MPRRSKPEVVYRGSAYFVLMSFGTVFFVLFTAVLAADRNVAGTIFFGLCSCVLVWVVVSQCRRVDLHGDGTLVVRYFLRRRFVSTIDAVQEIAFERDDDAANNWAIEVMGRNVELRDNSGAKVLVNELVRRNPDIVVTGWKPSAKEPPRRM